MLCSETICLLEQLLFNILYRNIYIEGFLFRYCCSIKISQSSISGRPGILPGRSLNDSHNGILSCHILSEIFCDLSLVPDQGIFLEHRFHPLSLLCVFCRVTLTYCQIQHISHDIIHLRIGTYSLRYHKLSGLFRQSAFL